MIVKYQQVGPIIDRRRSMQSHNATAQSLPIMARIGGIKDHRMFGFSRFFQQHHRFGTGQIG